MRESDPELHQVFARLRQVSGPALAAGQTPCCYALSIDHPLLRTLESILDAILPTAKKMTSARSMRHDCR